MNDQKLTRQEDAQWGLRSNMKARMQRFMVMAIEEAKESLKEGNCGFGAVIVRNDEVIARAHDTEKTQQDPTAHAEMTAIRMASAKLGRDLSDCMILSTHEPCPMCATAILWSGIRKMVFGFSIQEAIQQGRKRIDLSCQEIFDRAGRPVTIIKDMMRSECAVLYNKQVRDCVNQLRGVNDEQIAILSRQMSEKRLLWFKSQQGVLDLSSGTLLERAYQVFLAKLGLSASEAPIVEHGSTRIVIHSRNFCPTLEACKILGLDTRRICAQWTETPMDLLLKQVDERLCFSRNYNAIRPHCEYCEEIIFVAMVLFTESCHRA